MTNSKLISVAIAFLLLSSCQENLKEINLIPNDSNYGMERYFNLSLCSQQDSVDLMIAYSLGNFFDEIVEDGWEVFKKRDSMMIEYLSQNNLDTVPIEDAVNLYIGFHEMDSVIVQNYFDVIVEHRGFLLSGERTECIIAGLDNYAVSMGQIDEIEEQLEERFIFSTLARIAGADCDVQVYAGIVDAALEAAAGVALSTTGVGLVIGLTSAAGSLADAIHTGLNCP